MRGTHPRCPAAAGDDQVVHNTACPRRLGEPVRAGVGHAADSLFLDGIEAGSDAGVLLAFDFGDLYQLVTRLDDEGNPAEVSIRA